MKVFKLLLLLCLLSGSFAFASDINVTVISDAHISVDKQENSMTPSIEKLLKAVDVANKDTSDAVIFLGDNIQSTDRISLAMFAKIIKRLHKPYYVVVGNRDIAKSKNLTEKEYYRILNKFSSNRISELPSYKKQGDLVFVFMSGVNETFPTYRGYYKQNELSYLDKILTKFEDKKVIIFQHFPILPPKVDENRATVRTESYFEVLSRHKNVIAIISGHYHKENINKENGISHISVGALSQNGEFEQIKFFENSDNTYSITTKILNVE